MLSRSIPGAGLLSAALALLVFLPAAAESKIRLIQREVLRLEIRILGAGSIVGESPRAMDVDPEHGGEASIEIRWPGPDDEAVLRLRAGEQPSLDHEHLLRIQAELELAGGRTVRSERSLGFSAPTTTLFEVHREVDTPLTLAIEIDSDVETVYTPLPTVGDPVQLRLEIQRVAGEEVVLLETDLLQTFVGEPVAYSFKLGDGPEAESGRIELRPTRVVGALIELEVDVSGMLPAPDGLAMTSRREKWVMSRGVASSLTFAAGDPPSGYRFQVTSDF